MVVLGRNEINRMRLAGALAIVSAIAVLIGVASTFPGSSGPVRLGLMGLGLVAVVTLVLSIFPLIYRRATSKLLLFHQGNDYVVATNHLHDGFKLRFFREVLSDAVGPLSDDDRDPVERTVAGRLPSGLRDTQHPENCDSAYQLHAVR